MGKRPNTPRNEAAADSRQAGGGRPFDSRRVKLGLGLALLAAIIVAFGLWSSNLIDDDAFIFFRYADNIVDGNGPTWNPGGERVEGYSSFLWLMILVGARAAGLDAVLAAHLLNGFFLLAAIVVSGWLVKELDGRWTSTSITTAMLLATSAAFTMWSRIGMETMLFAALLVLATTLTIRRSQNRFESLATGLVHGLMILTRPEGALLTAVCLGWVILENRRGQRSLFGRPEILWLTGLVLVVVPHLIWRYSYYQSWLPNTYYAKVGMREGVINRGLGGLLSYLDSIRGVLTVAALAFWFTRGNRREARLLLAALIAWILYLVVFLGLPAWNLWYSMPVDLFTLLLLGLAAGRIATNANGEGGWSSRRWLTAAGLVVVLVNVSPAIVGNRTEGKGLRLAVLDPPTDTRVHQFATIGSTLRRIAPPDTTVAVGACGAIPYYSGLVTYDVLGLNDRHIAHMTMTGPATDAFGHEKGDGAYILSRKPTILMPLPLLTRRPTQGHAGFEKSFIEIYQHPAFRRDYEYQNIQLEEGPYAGRFVNFWRRIEGGSGS